MTIRTRCNHLKPLALSGLLLLSATCQTWAAVAEDYYQNGKNAMNGGDLQGAINYFDQLRKLYPHDPYANQALLEMGYAYYKLADSDAAINMLDGFIAEQPDHPHIPYAYYLAGLARYDEAAQMFTTANTEQGNARIAAITDQALGYFGLLIDRYPGSQYVADARQKSTHLLEQLMLRRIDTHVASAPNGEERTHSEVKDANWLLGQPPTYFTLQLTTNPKLEEIHQLIKTHDLKDKAIIYELQRQNGSVFVLLYGTYLNKRAAMEAGSLLPEPILRGQPWVREVSSAQIDIRQSRLAMAGASDNSKPKAVKPSAKATPVPVPQKAEAVEPAPAPQVAAAETTAIPSIAVAPVITPSIETAPEMKAAETPAAQVAPSEPARVETSASGPRREQWLLSQNPQHYTLQVTAVSQEKTAQQFINQHKLADQAAYFRHLRDNKEFYSVTVGSYPTKQSAMDAAKNLPGLQPWVRKFSDVHSAIRSTQ